jgi:hypothetical protein
MNGNTLDDVLKIITVFNILAPNIAHLFTVIRHQDGTATISIQVDANDEAGKLALERIERWKRGEQLT